MAAMTMTERAPAATAPAAAAQEGAAAAAEEIDEVSREFQRSRTLSASHPRGDDDAPVPAPAASAGDAADSGGADDPDAGARLLPPARTGEGEAEAGDAEEEAAPPRPRTFVAPKDFELLKVVGMGAFGKVLQVRERSSSRVFAMKVISKRLIKRKGSYVENILAERNILTKISSNPFVVTMHASFQTREKLFIVMDFCAGGELFLKVAKEGHFRERTAAYYLAEITLALEHLHSVNVLHRDLKPENILLGSDGHCCLTDFGLAKDFTGSGDDEGGWARTLCGTIEYMAPEMVARKWYGKGADYWSLGCIAYEMLSGLPPFSSKKGSKELFKKIMNERIRMPDGASAAACKLLKGLLNRDAGKRLGAARGTMFEMGGVGALKQHPFFSGLDWGKLELKEIDPPEEFSVDNDEDLRHFHDDFVKMSLPRSVKEMSKLDFLPRRCESDNFRGFSFICDSFPLPDRTASEQDHYWNNVDNDGQSLSECASSVFDDDMGEVAPEPVVPEKKKRPPRKKKKKKQQPVPPLETTEEVNEAPGSANAQEGEAKVKNVGDAMSKHDKSNSQLGNTNEVKDEDEEATPKLVNNTNQSNKGEPDAALDGKKQLPQPSGTKGPKPVEIHPIQSTTVIEPSATAPNSLNPNARAWSVGAPAKPAPHATMQMRRQMAAPQTVQVRTKPVAAPSYAPKPGTWASLAVGNAKPNGVQRSNAQPTPIVVASNGIPVSTRPSRASMVTSAAGVPASPRSSQTPLSPDWRNHALSPHRKVISPRSMSQQIPVPPPPVSQPVEIAWPSLGDFPPPPGNKPKTPSQNKPAGAWGRAS